MPKDLWERGKRTQRPAGTAIPNAQHPISANSTKSRPPLLGTVSLESPGDSCPEEAGRGAGLEPKLAPLSPQLTPGPLAEDPALLARQVLPGQRRPLCGSVRAPWGGPHIGAVC